MRPWENRRHGRAGVRGAGVERLHAPATAADPVKLGDVQQAMEALAKTDGVVGAIGEVYVDGKRVGQGTAGSRLLDGKGGTHPAGLPLPDRRPRPS